MAVVSIFILIVAGYFFIFEQDKSETTNHITTKWENSIAVLPFENISADPEQEYFCDGMTEQIISNLTKLQKLKVIARTSVMTYKNTDKKIPEIGKELNVTHILEGSVRKFGDRMRVTAQLIKTEDGFHVWSEDYDKEYADLFDVQDEISQKIARALLKNLSVSDAGQIKTYKPASIEAWEYLKKGEHIHLERFFGATWSISDFKDAERLLKKAIELDPDYAISYAFLADLYNTYSAIIQTEEEKAKNLKLQETYIQRAVDIDPNLAEVQVVMSFIYRDKNEVDEEYASVKRALEINPNYRDANIAASWFFGNRGLYALALKYMSKAVELDPLYVNSYVSRTYYFQDLGDYAQAETDYRKGLEINPKHVDCLYGYGELLIRLKRYEEAEKILNQIEKFYPDKNTNKLHALIYASKGDKEKALDTLKGKSSSIFALLGMKDEAISLLYKYYEQNKESKRSWYLYYKYNPFYDNLRSDPRFQEILAKSKKLYEENLAKYGDIDI
jgi:TolB-like protein/Tfp pilus assembly protein PilF